MVITSNNIEKVALIVGAGLLHARPQEEGGISMFDLRWEQAIYDGVHTLTNAMRAAGYEPNLVMKWFKRFKLHSFVDNDKSLKQKLDDAFYLDIEIPGWKFMVSTYQSSYNGKRDFPYYDLSE
jgi:hypothetical protein